ncbi:copper/zinc superoxide dismutase [Klebsormidium nitens]|uniref:superoxide dismutase n=1 Tax=Klebsormidium nitens TaxID=105231 RepID=A0A1Y1IE33_KLENI|nr:copper/zinc superoxide dismutase [Klebsormidium nitens]|eukprot:GAQ86348.1 copper/zinc superoxide dismutase [Klebsormidium nitens]
MACTVAIAFSGPAALTIGALVFRPEAAASVASSAVLPKSFWGLPVHAAPVPIHTRKLAVQAQCVGSFSEARAVGCQCGPECPRRDFLLGLALASAALAQPAEAAAAKVAVAKLVPTKGSTAFGEVTFTESSGFFGGRKVKVDVNIGGLSPGMHGFHIHEIGDVTCDDGLCTGGHYNPSKKPHGAPGSEERHVGDLGNIRADNDGKVQTTLEDVVISLDGPSSIVGHSVVVHFGQDDLESQPSGNAGGRAAYATVRLV